MKVEQIVWPILVLFILGISGCRLSSDGPASVEAAQDTPEVTVGVVPEAAPDLSDSAGEGKEANDPPTGSAARDSLALAARVNDQPIFLYIYEQRVAQMKQALAATTPEAEGPEQLAQVKQQVLDGLIEEVIIKQEANRLGIVVSDPVLEANIREILQKQEESRLEAWLAANQLTYDTFRKTVRSQLVAQRLFQQVTGEIAKTADQIQVRYILAPDEATARTVIDQLKAGTDFKTAAQTAGVKGTGANGDLSDWFPRQLSPLPMPVTAAAFSLEPGQMSGPIQSTAGFFVIKVERKEAERPLTTEAFRRLQEKVFADWLLEQRSMAVIEQVIAF